MPRAFTLKSEGLLSTLITDCKVSTPFVPPPTGSAAAMPPLHDFKGLWDTGATNTTISQKVVTQLGLHPTGAVNVNHAGGTSLRSTYFDKLLSA